MRPAILLVFLLKFMDCTRPDSEDNGFVEKIETNKILKPNLHEKLAAVHERILSNPKKLPLLKLPKKDIVGSAKQKRCQLCMESLRCKTLNKCDHCEKFCQQEDPEPEPVVGSRLHEDAAVGSSAAKPSPGSRYYTVGSFGPGPKQDLLARLLNIAQKDNLEKLVVLAKHRGRGQGGHPLIIDTAGVFPKDGGEIAVHEVKAKDSLQDMRLTSMIDHELEKALAQKQKLTDKLVDRIIDKVLKLQGQRPELTEKRADLGSRMLGTPHITTKRSISSPRDLKPEDDNRQGFQGKLFPAKSPPGSAKGRSELVADEESDSASSEEEPPAQGSLDQQPNLSQRSNFGDEEESQPSDEARQSEREQADNDEDQIVTLAQPPDVFDDDENDQEVVGSWLEDETGKASKWYHDNIGLNFEDKKSRSSQNSDNVLKPEQFILLLQNLAKKVEDVAVLVKKTCGQEGDTVGNAQPNSGDIKSGSLSDGSKEHILKSLKTIQRKTTKLIDEAQDNANKLAQELEQSEPDNVGAPQPQGDNKTSDVEAQDRMLDPQERMGEESAHEDNNKLEPQEPTVACSNEDSDEYLRESQPQVESRFRDPKDENETVACSNENESDEYLRESPEKNKNQDLQGTESVPGGEEKQPQNLSKLNQRMKLLRNNPELNKGEKRAQAKFNERRKLPQTSRKSGVESRRLEDNNEEGEQNEDPENVAKANNESEQPSGAENAPDEVGCSEESDEDDYIYSKGGYRTSQNQKNPAEKSAEEAPLEKLKSLPNVKPLHELLHHKEALPKPELSKLFEKPDNKPAPAHRPNLLKTLEEAKSRRAGKQKPLLMGPEERKPAAAHRPKFLKTVPIEEEPTHSQSRKPNPALKAVERLGPDMIHTDGERQPLQSEAHGPSAFSSNDEGRGPLRPDRRHDIFRSKETELPGDEGKNPAQPGIFRSNEEREPSSKVPRPRFRPEEERPKRPQFFTRRNQLEEERPKRPPPLASEDFDRNEDRPNRPPHFRRVPEGLNQPEEERPNGPPSPVSMPRDFDQEDDSQYSDLEPVPPLRQRFGEDPTLGAKKDLQEVPDNIFGRVIPQDYEGAGFGEMPDKVYFVGTGMHLPLNMKKQNDGSYQISVDIKNLCKTCADGACGETVVGMKAPQISAAPEEENSPELQVKGKNTENAEHSQPLPLNNSQNGKVISQRSIKSIIHDLLDDPFGIDVDAKKDESISNSNVEDSSEELLADSNTKNDEIIPQHSVATLDEQRRDENVKSEDLKQSELSKRSPKFNMYIPSFNSYDSREDTEGLKNVNSMKSYNQNQKFNTFYEEPNNDDPEWSGEEKSMIKRRVSIVNNVLNWMKDIAVN